ncbi:metallophosphoesterase 1 isoform X4 [Onychostoma macrolepis]|nr:metallophosphoesterase 1 isoform X4 [Onychostoma macrolepis]
MERAFQTSLWLLNPEVVFILGDVFDEGKWSSSQDWEDDIRRFKRIFRHPSDTELVVLIGNHDIGFHNEMTKQKLERFEQVFNVTSARIITIKGVKSMKAALRASLKDKNWVDKLPWVMLGIRTAPKEDLQSSSAELVYGQPVRVPGDFVPSIMVPWSATLQRSALLDNARLFAPVPTSRHGLPQSHIPAGLQAADYVFIRHDAHRGLLHPPYEGPFRVLETGDKHFVVDRGGKPERLSIDRLKPAHLDVARPIDLAQPPRRGRPPVLRPPLAPLTPKLSTLHAPHTCNDGTPPAVGSPRPPVQRSRCGRLIRPPPR